MAKTMVLLFFFLILLKNTLAIAATPPLLEFYSDEVKSFTIFNTNDYGTRFIIEPEAGLIFSQNKFMLPAKGKIVVNVTAKDAKKQNGIIYVRELASGGRGLILENGIGLKYEVNYQMPSNKITTAILGLPNKLINGASTVLFGAVLIAVILVLFSKNNKKKGDF